MPGRLDHIADRVFNTPLVVSSDKAQVILSALSARLGVKAPLDLAQLPTDRRTRSGLRVEDGVAFIDVTGTLVYKGSGLGSEVDALSGNTTYSKVEAELEAALADPSVDGVLLDIDSPGGECVGCFEAAAKILAAREKKPIFAAVSPMACSGAYALASGASKIFAPKVSYVGSIGVVNIRADQSKADEQEGVTYTSVYVGDHKDFGNPHAPMTDAERADTKGRLGRIYDVFVASVAAGRGLSESKVRATEAAVYLGEQAIEKGLVDELGGRTEALTALRADIHQRKNAMKELEQLKADLSAANGRADTAEKKLQLVEATLAEREKLLAGLQADAAERKKASLDAVVKDLEDRCVAGGASPPTKIERDDIRSALDVNEALGRKLAGAVLERCLARVSAPGAKTTNLDPAETEAQKARREFINGVKVPGSGTKEK